jgi:hypothetical protein
VKEPLRRIHEGILGLLGSITISAMSEDGAEINPLTVLENV